jgi:hypothetical protein
MTHRLEQNLLLSLELTRSRGHGHFPRVSQILYESFAFLPHLGTLGFGRYLHMPKI